jgi:hypothetical protein
MTNSIFPINKLRLRLAFLLKRSVNMNKASKIYIDTKGISLYIRQHDMFVKKGKDLNKLLRAWQFMNANNISVSDYINWMQGYYRDEIKPM